MTIPASPAALALLAPVAFAAAPLAASPTHDPPPAVRPVWSDPDFAGAASVDAADFDGDGLLDLAGSSYYDDEFVWWRQTPDQQFERHSVFPINTAFDFEAADLDGDGDPDLYGSSLSSSPFGEDTVWWFENRLSETGDYDAAFVPHLLFVFPNQDPRSMDAADFDGDGHLDLAVAFVYDEDIHLFLNPTGQGPQGPPLLVEVPQVNGVAVVQGVDFDADGDVDLVAGTAWNSTYGVNVYWYENYGNAVFGPRIPIAGGSDFAALFTVRPADVDGDGLIDVVTAHDGTFGSPFVRWIPRRDPAGTEWGDPIVVDPAFYGSTGDQGLAVSDLDGDGDLDLLGGSFLVDRKVRAWLNNGVGEFTSFDLDTDAGAHGVLAADLDGDGLPEVAAAQWGECCYSGGMQLWKLRF